MHDLVSQSGHWLRTILWQGMGLKSPFCPLYLASAALCCGIWLLTSRRESMDAILRSLQTKVRIHRRSLLEDGLWTLAQFFLLRIPLALLHVSVFQFSYETVLNWGDEAGVDLSAPQWMEILLVTLVTMLAIDFSAYAMHRALHSHPWLWRIHSVHHRSRFLTPLATFRQHPLEPAFLACARGLAAGSSLGLLHILFPRCTPVWTIAGMGIGFFAYMFTVNLHHFPIPLRFPAALRRILISPHVHHLHHSRAAEHHGKNFGVIFSFWDRLFGTYLDHEFGIDELEFGVEEDSPGLREPRTMADHQAPASPELC